MLLLISSPSLLENGKLSDQSPQTQTQRLKVGHIHLQFGCMSNLYGSSFHPARLYPDIYLVPPLILWFCSSPIIFTLIYVVHDVVTVYVMNATNDRPADLTPLTGYSYEVCIVIECRKPSPDKYLTTSLYFIAYFC